MDFNSLDMTINLQTWVDLLDFLGVGVKVHDLERSTVGAKNVRQVPQACSVDKKGGYRMCTHLPIICFVKVFNEFP